MDKKIILSVLIVALIGIVAATYQINPTQDILNPLASVDTEDTPITEVLTAPEESQQEAQAQAENEAQQEAQAQAENEAQAQAQQEAQAEAEAQAQQAQDEANAQAQQEAQAEAQPESTQGDSSLAGSTSRSSIVNAENPITISSSATSSSSSGSSDSGSSSGDSNVPNSGSGSSDASASPSNDRNPSSNNGNPSTTPDNGDGSNDNPTSDDINPPADDEEIDGTPVVDDNTWSEIDTVIQNAQDSFAFGISADRDSCSVDENGLYQVKVYNSETSAFIGTLFVNIDKNSEEYGQWYLIDVNGDAQGPDVRP